MKKLFAFAIATAISLSTAYAQNTGGDTDKVSKSKTTMSEKSKVKGGAAKTSATKAPQAQPFPTRKPADKTQLHGQPPPPGAGQASQKVELNPQPLPPGAKLADKPVHSSSTKARKQGKVTADSGKKASTGIEKGSIKQE